MDDTIDRYDALLRSGARQLTGYRRRQFQAEVARALCGGSPRAVEERFGWGRETVRKGLTEARTGIRCVEDFAARGRRRSEDRDPALAAEILGKSGDPAPLTLIILRAVEIGVSSTATIPTRA